MNDSLFRRLCGLLDKYKAECLMNNECLTYRGLLQWLEEQGLHIDYEEGLDLKLMEFNNEVYDILKQQLESKK